MLKLFRVTKLKVFFLVPVYVFNFTNFNLFESSAAILEKGLFQTKNQPLRTIMEHVVIWVHLQRFIAVRNTRVFVDISEKLLLWFFLGHILALIPRQWLVGVSEKPLVPGYDNEAQPHGQVKPYFQWIVLRHSVPFLLAWYYCQKDLKHVD